MLVCTNLLCNGTHTLFLYSPSRWWNSSYDIDLSPLWSNVLKRDTSFGIVFDSEKRRPNRGRPMMA